MLNPSPSEILLVTFPFSIVPTRLLPSRLWRSECRERSIDGRTPSHPMVRWHLQVENPLTVIYTCVFFASCFSEGKNLGMSSVKLWPVSCPPVDWTMNPIPSNEKFFSTHVACVYTSPIIQKYPTMDHDFNVVLLKGCATLASICENSQGIILVLDVDPTGERIVVPSYNFCFVSKIKGRPLKTGRVGNQAIDTSMLNNSQ